MKKLLIGSLVISMGLGMVWTISRLEQQKRGAHAITPSAALPAIEFQGMNLIEFSGGDKLWDLTARSVSYDADHTQALLEEIRVRFWEQGRVVSMAQAPLASLETGSRNLVMKGGIQVSATEADTRFDAREVEWVAASQSLHASGDVAFRRGPSQLAGPELWADRSLKRVRMGKAIQARVQMDTGWK